jgi:hypothetical protein
LTLSAGLGEKKTRVQFSDFGDFFESLKFYMEETEETLGDFELPEAEISPHPLAESTKKFI